MDYLRELLNKKELIATSNEDIEKINVIKDLFNDDAIFFKMDIDTAFGILEFLDVPKEEIKKTYLSLISPTEYMNNAKPYFMGPVQK